MDSRGYILLVAIISTPIIIMLERIFHLNEVIAFCIVIVPGLIIVSIWSKRIFEENNAEKLARARESKKRRQEEKKIRKELKKERREKRQ